MKAPGVIMVLGRFYPLLGGAEQQALQLAGRLIKSGIPVAVLTRHVPGQPVFETINAIAVHRRIRTLSWGKLFGITYFFSCLWQLYRLRSTYTIIHCHILDGMHSLAAVCLKRLLGKKVIIKVAMAGQISDFALMKKMRLGRAMLRQLRGIDALIAICAQVGQEARCEGFPPERIQPLPNGVDVAWFTPAADAEKIPGRLLCVGSLDPRKNVSLLIRAVRALTDAGTAVSLDIAGDGPEAPHLRALAAGLGSMQQISFLGACHDIRPLLQRAQLFVLPSDFEGLPNVVLEAMACGLPVVATRVGGVPELIEHGVNGMLVPPGDCAALCAAIQELLSDQARARELGSRARQTVVKKFSLESVAARYEALYRQLCA